MKLRSIWAVGCWVLVTVLLFSCSKFKSYENPALTGGDTLGNNGLFKATINGISWVSTQTTDTAYAQNGTLTIYGVNNINQSIVINLGGTTIGAYQLNANTVSIATYVDGNSANINVFTTNQSSDTSQAGGEVTVTDIDTLNNTISGSFQLNVFRSSDGQQKTITQGVFSKIPFTAAPPQQGNADTFYVQIDTASWAPPNIEADSSSGQFVISGASLDGTMSVSLTMPQNITPGSYNLAYSSATYFGQYIPNDSTILESQGNGTLQILENNSITGRLRGNFNFLAQPLSGSAPSVQLNNGYFSVNVQ